MRLSIFSVALMATALFCLATACASFTLIRTSNEPRRAPKRPEQVVVLSAPPERPHHEVGVFTFTDLRESDAAFTQRLVALAAEEGCDVVLAIPGRSGSPSCLYFDEEPPPPPGRTPQL